ncbi:MAG: NUDIX domain-containing protein [Pseudomonadota bacterium]
MAIEYSDIVDADDNVIGRMTRKDAYAGKHMIRIVYVFVIDPETGNVGLAKRAGTVSFCPLHYGSTASGHVEAGEDWDYAAQRETEEEIGLTGAPLHLVSRQPGTDPRNGLTFIEGIYMVSAKPSDLVPYAAEVDSIIFMPPEDLRAFVKNNPCHPRLAEQIDILLHAIAQPTAPAFSKLAP